MRVGWADRLPSNFNSYFRRSRSALVWRESVAPPSPPNDLDKAAEMPQTLDSPLMGVNPHKATSSHSHAFAVESSAWRYRLSPFVTFMRRGRRQRWLLEPRRRRSLGGAAE